MICGDRYEATGKPFTAACVAWECPRCVCVNAPHVDACACQGLVGQPRSVGPDSAPPVHPDHMPTYQPTRPVTYEMVQREIESIGRRVGGSRSRGWIWLDYDL